MTTSPIKTKAARVLSDATQDADSKSVAAFVLGSPPPKGSRTLPELRALLARIDGKEGQKDRANDIRGQISQMEAGQ